MALLRNETKNQPVVDKLKIARTFWQRGIGLMGKKHLPQDEGLWILRCNSIHTFFMKFPIDVIFVDKKLNVVQIKENLSRSRITLPTWKASSVIELAAGVVSKANVQVGDRLSVVGDSCG